MAPEISQGAGNLQVGAASGLTVLCNAIQWHSVLHILLECTLLNTTPVLLLDERVGCFTDVATLQTLYCWINLTMMAAPLLLGRICSLA